MNVVRKSGLVALVALNLSCGGGSSSPTPATPPTTVAAVPSPSPTVAPSAAPSPSAATACRFGKGTPDTFCARRSAVMLGDIDRAIDRAIQAHPTFFNTGDSVGPGAYRVLRSAEYHQAVVAELQAAGFCAETDTTTVSVRNGTEFSEDYDIILGTGHVRRGDGSYRQTCSPPSFPLDAADVIAYVRVAFYSIRCPEGVAIPRNGEDKLPIGCTGFVTASPKTKDNLDVNERLVGSRIDWTLEQEGEKVRVSDFEGQAFNKIVFAASGGHYNLCAEVKGIKGCQFGEVVEQTKVVP
jgi:hypothetical protein